MVYSSYLTCIFHCWIIWLWCSLNVGTARAATNVQWKRRQKSGDHGPVRGVSRGGSTVVRADEWYGEKTKIGNGRTNDVGSIQQKWKTRSHAKPTTTFSCSILHGTLFLHTSLLKLFVSWKKNAMFDQIVLSDVNCNSSNYFEFWYQNCILCIKTKSWQKDLKKEIYTTFFLNKPDNLIEHIYVEYIWSAVSLYLDMINLFLSLLTVFRALQR